MRRVKESDLTTYVAVETTCGFCERVERIKHEESRQIDDSDIGEFLAHLKQEGWFVVDSEYYAITDVACPECQEDGTIEGEDE